MLIVVVVLLVLGHADGRRADHDRVGAAARADRAAVRHRATLQFGLVFVVTCLIGLVTPPVGIILFMTSSIANVKLEPLSLAVLPFVIWMTIVVILMVFFPSLTLWLPKLVGF